MATNLVVESPDFDKIRKESGWATEDAVKRLWYVLNDEIRVRRISVRQATDKIDGVVITDAPSAQQDDYDAANATVIYFNGTTSFTFTGLRNGTPGRVLFIHNGNTATITIGNAHAGSATTNRIVTSTGGDKSLTQDTTIILQYIDDRWREASLI